MSFCTAESSIHDLAYTIHDLPSFALASFCKLHEGNVTSRGEDSTHKLDQVCSYAVPLTSYTCGDMLQEQSRHYVGQLNLTSANEVKR